jgi:hypothetical protein
MPAAELLYFGVHFCSCLLAACQLSGMKYKAEQRNLGLKFHLLPQNMPHAGNDDLSRSTLGRY